MSAKQQQLGSGFSIASLVLGIVAFVLGFFGFGIILGILAIVFGIIGVRSRSGKGMAIAGIITGGLSILVGLIFLIVLISLPALQQNQRDSLRKSEVATVSNAITMFESNNRGALPTEEEIISTEFATTYFYSNEHKIAVTGEPSTEVILYSNGVTCPENGSTQGARHYNLQIRLESGSVYCVND